MDYIDKSDVFIIKLTGKKMYFTVNSQIFSIKKKSVLKLVVL